MYKVLKDFKGSPDGCRVIQYTEGQMLEEGSDFSKDLAEVALNEKWVELVTVKRDKKKADDK